jgi:hypothetical protein
MSNSPLYSPDRRWALTHESRRRFLDRRSCRERRIVDGRNKVSTAKTNRQRPKRIVYSQSVRGHLRRWGGTGWLGWARHPMSPCHPCHARIRPPSMPPPFQLRCCLLVSFSLCSPFRLVAGPRLRGHLNELGKREQLINNGGQTHSTSPLERGTIR